MVSQTGLHVFTEKQRVGLKDIFPPENVILKSEKSLATLFQFLSFHTARGKHAPLHTLFIFLVLEAQAKGRKRN